MIHMTSNLPRRKARKLLSKEDVEMALHLRAFGLSQSLVAATVGVSLPTINRILSGQLPARLNSPALKCRILEVEEAVREQSLYPRGRRPKPEPVPAN